MRTRRGFLGLLASVAAGAVLDPEKLLWVPGQKVISIPKAPIEPVMFIVSAEFTWDDTDKLWRTLTPMNPRSLFNVSSESQQFLVGRWSNDPVAG